ncbi:MAG: hypothetical protein AB8B51_02490 [Sedimentitalea sp.]
MDLLGRELIVVGGTRTKAVNGKDRNFIRASFAKLIAQSDERFEKDSTQLDTGDEGENVVPVMT